jgi:hypothetical protein
MDPKIIFYGLLLFVFCLTAHITLWRIRIPRNDALMLVFIFFGLPVFVALIICVPGLIAQNIRTELVMTLAQVLVFHGALSSAYIASYPAATAHSPSLAILLIIGAAPLGRLTGDEIARLYRNEHTIIRRAEDLEVYGMLGRKDNSYVLKPVAYFIIRFYILYRKLLGLPPGEG